MSDNAIAAVILMTLEDFDNETLAALNLAIQAQGCVPKGNKGYAQALKAQLITESGYPTFDTEPTRKAFAYEVMRRVEAGEWD